MSSRIPLPAGQNLDGMSQWFSAMSDANLIFHPEDSADSIVFADTGEPFFSAEEASVVQSVLDAFFSIFGEEAVINACYPHFMRAVRRTPGLEGIGTDFDA